MSDTTITLTMPGMDDCDGATLVGILRDALAQLPREHRGRDFLLRAPLTATVNRTMAPDPYVEAMDFGDPLLRACDGCGAEPMEPCRPMCLGEAAAQDEAAEGTRWSADEREA